MGNYRGFKSHRQPQPLVILCAYQGVAPSSWEFDTKNGISLSKSWVVSSFLTNLAQWNVCGTRLICRLTINYSLQPCQLIVAWSSSSQTWRRGEVVARLGLEEYEVFLIDFGIHTIASTHDMRHLHVAFSHLEAQVGGKFRRRRSNDALCLMILIGRGMHFGRNHPIWGKVTLV